MGLPQRNNFSFFYKHQTNLPNHSAVAGHKSHPFLWYREFTGEQSFFEGQLNDKSQCNWYHGRFLHGLLCIIRLSNGLKILTLDKLWSYTGWTQIAAPLLLVDFSFLVFKWVKRETSYVLGKYRCQTFPTDNTSGKWDQPYSDFDDCLVNRDRWSMTTGKIGFNRYAHDILTQWCYNRWPTWGRDLTNWGAE